MPNTRNGRLLSYLACSFLQEEGFCFLNCEALWPSSIYERAAAFLAYLYMYITIRSFWWKWVLQFCVWEKWERVKYIYIYIYIKRKVERKKVTAPHFENLERISLFYLIFFCMFVSLGVLRLLGLSSFIYITPCIPHFVSGFLVNHLC